MELIVALTVHDDESGVEGASSIAKEVTIYSEDEVPTTSIVDTWSWEVAGED